jgi:hypothetical protein
MTPATSSPPYFGRIVTVNPDGFGFIGISTVARENAEPHGLSTTKDIFIHQEDSGVELKVGSEVGFDVIADTRRGGDTLRAQGVVPVIEGEVISETGMPMPGFNIMAPQKRVAVALRGLLPVTGGRRAKEISDRDLAAVDTNQPMPGVPREEMEVSPEDGASFLNRILEMLFERLRTLRASFRIDSSDEDLDREVEETARTLREMRAVPPAEEMERSVASYKAIKAAFAHFSNEGIVRPNTVVPIRFLPDFFMAAPVWYFWTTTEEARVADETQQDGDPRAHPRVCDVVELIPGERWAHTFQLFNRRMRTLAHYQGDVIPGHIARRMKWASQLFDHVAIATPYHDAAGRDWGDLDWIRSIDPYIIGLKKGVPFFFILGRYSDSGVFPLYNEMLADTVNFLREKKGLLSNFSKVAVPYWHNGQVGRGRSSSVHGLGGVLTNHVDQMIQAFEMGQLFNWIRGEIDLPQDVRKVQTT